MRKGKPMPTSTARNAAFKPLTLPRSLSRVLRRLLAMPHEESLPLAKEAHANAQCPRQRIIAMRLRLRLLQEALQSLHAPVEEPPEPVVEIVEEPDPEPVEEPKPASNKTGKLVSMDLEGGALAMMMQGLGGSDDNDEGDDDFFSND
jgi:outer membrane biosynthesis protein TonB